MLMLFFLMLKDGLFCLLKKLVLFVLCSQVKIPLIFWGCWWGVLYIQRPEGRGGWGSSVTLKGIQQGKGDQKTQF